MPFHFCSQCGTKLQPEFRFCPSCGVKLPCPVDESESVNSTTSTILSPSKKQDAAASIGKTCHATSCEPAESTAARLARPALRKTRNSLRLDKEVKFSIKDATPSEVLLAIPPGQKNRMQISTLADASIPEHRRASKRSFVLTDDSVGCPVSPSKQHKVTFRLDPEVVPSLGPSSSPGGKVSRQVRGKTKISTPVKQVEEEKSLTCKTSWKAEGSTVDSSHVLSPVSSSICRSPVKAGKGKAKKAKFASAVEPLQEGEELTDTSGKKWILMKLLSQSTTELIYEVFQKTSQSNFKEPNHILKLGAKDGRIFNEQNFLQRAAKPASVEKWIKQHKLDFLGIPSCVGFGLHADSYRFLIFPNMGRSLQSVIVEEKECLSEKDVLQLTCRILDVLQYIHSNEYVHADVNAENIYIKQGHKSQVYLVGYCHSFRYCPAGQHVEFREASRASHEGNTEFISLDAHKGAAPSRRGDLQSLGYCMLHWHTGTLPWSSLTQPDQIANQKQRYMEDVPALLSHCFGKTRVSSAFKSYMTVVMALQYSQQPDYAALKAGLNTALLQLGGSLELPLIL